MKLLFVIILLAATVAVAENDPPLPPIVYGPAAVVPRGDGGYTIFRDGDMETFIPNSSGGGTLFGPNGPTIVVPNGQAFMIYPPPGHDE
jgi:hypothetical protein